MGTHPVVSGPQSFLIWERKEQQWQQPVCYIWDAVALWLYLDELFSGFLLQVVFLKLLLRGIKYFFQRACQAFALGLSPFLLSIVSSTSLRVESLIKFQNHPWMQTKQNKTIVIDMQGNTPKSRVFLIFNLCVCGTCMCTYVHLRVYVEAMWRSEEQVGSSGAGVTTSCELAVCDRNWTPVLYKDS